MLKIADNGAAYFTTEKKSERSERREGLEERSSSRNVPVLILGDFYFVILHSACGQMRLV